MPLHITSDARSESRMKQGSDGLTSQPCADAGDPCPALAPEASPSAALAQWMMQRGYATGHGDTFADLLAELTAQHDAPTPIDLLRRLDIANEADGSRLVVMAQSPSNYHNWTKAVGKFTAGEVRKAIAKAASR